MTHPVDIAHQHAKIRKLRVISQGVKMRRAIRIRKIRRKGVRNKMIHAAHQQKIHQPFHQRHALAPAVGPEHFAHGAALLKRLQMRPCPA